METPEEVLSHMEVVDEFVDNFFAHYGKLGMKWGVRRAENAQKEADRFKATAEKKPTKANQELARITQKNADKKAAKITGATAANAKVSNRQRKKEAVEAHAAWKKEAGGTEMANKAFQQAAKTFEPTLKKINNDPMFKGKNLTLDRGLAREYDAVVGTIFNQHLAQASIDLTINDQGRAYIYEFDRNRGMMRGREYQAVLDHADEKSLPDYKVELDDLGQIVSFEPESLNLEHSGVKGMRWGVTKVKNGLNNAVAEIDRKDAEITKAREAHPELRSKYKDAKKQYKVDKQEVGRKEAKKVLNAHGKDYYNNLFKAMESTNSEKAERYINNAIREIDKKNIERDYQRRVDAGKQSVR